MTSGKILDPVCDMIVDLVDAREHGLTIEYPEHEYGFCSAACQTKFAKNPKAYIPKVEAWLVTAGHAHATQDDAHPTVTSGAIPIIDAGMRAWYSSCRCCLSDAHPQVVEILDKERVTAEASETKTT